MARVQAAAREEAERHRSRVRAAIANPRYTTLMLALGGWIAGKGWQAGVAGAAQPDGPLTQKVAKAAPHLVQAAATRVRKRARDFDPDGAQPEGLHKVRIAAKKERYAREFFAALDTDKRTTKQNGKRHDVLTGMQDELGEVNDSVVARTLVAQLRERVPQEAALLGFIDGVLAERALDALPRVGKHVKGRLREKASG
jgi:CHAD domain-containing protein